MRVAFVVLSTLLLLGSPVWGQEKQITWAGDDDLSTDEVERLLLEVLKDLNSKDWEVRSEAIGDLADFYGPNATRQIVPALIVALSDEVTNVRGDAAYALKLFGEDAEEAVPALMVALCDEDYGVRSKAAFALGQIGLASAPAIATLITTRSEGDGDTEAGYGVRLATTWALTRIGADLKAKGTVLYWVVPRTYAKELAGLLILLAAWFALMARFPKHRPTSTFKHLALMALTAAVSVSLSCSAVGYAITRDWGQGFLPDTLTLVPFPVAAVLSTALVVTLPAVWVCQRKSVTPEVEELGV
jgi:hypothetical protein